MWVHVHVLNTYGICCCCWSPHGPCGSLALCSQGSHQNYHHHHHYHCCRRHRCCPPWLLWSSPHTLPLGFFSSSHWPGLCVASSVFLLAPPLINIKCWCVNTGGTYMYMFTNANFYSMLITKIWTLPWKICQKFLKPVKSSDFLHFLIVICIHYDIYRYLWMINPNCMHSF